MGLGKAMGFEQEQCAELDSYYLSWIAEKEQIFDCRKGTDLCNSSLVWDILHRACKQFPTTQEISAWQGHWHIRKDLWSLFWSHILALPFLPSLLHGPPRLLCPLWLCWTRGVPSHPEHSCATTAVQQTYGFLQQVHSLGLDLAIFVMHTKWPLWGFF